MEVKLLIKEIKRLPLKKRFFVMEQTLKSVKDDELSQNDENIDESLNNEVSHLVNEKSLAKEWLSTEDNRWDQLL